MTPYQLIAKKRDGASLTAPEMDAFFGGYGRGVVTEYQMAAFLMAVFMRGMDRAELSALVSTLLHSGTVIDLSSVPGTKVDKHSTGGVGDKVSLVLAPLVAALGVPVPMMSGRGLGHSGGTVDKLESIPGFRTALSVAEFRAQLERIGCALISQTEEVAPLDRRLYALRDVTATVESIPLIASSIMSKKLASGIDALVLDVKHGNGAFMADADRAEELARTMIEIGAGHGRRTVALLTAMDRPLGHAVGNALEVEEAVLALRGEGPADLLEVTLALAVEMLVLGGAAATPGEGRAAARAALSDGRAASTFQRVIEAQGGNPAVVDDPALLPQAPVQRVLAAARGGCVAAMDVRAIGQAAVDIGAGRSSLDSRIDPAVGFHITAKPGLEVMRGQPIATVHAADDEAAERALVALRSAIRIADAAEPALPLIGKRLISTP
ncbi:MAG TPA: thymidine phosphorylase [Longimicrobiales bacterium]|nr:thymidine phosphorylase [Longimicrobiales bacterium]